MCCVRACLRVLLCVSRVPVAEDGEDVGTDGDVEEGMEPPELVVVHQPHVLLARSEPSVFGHVLVDEYLPAVREKSRRTGPFSTSRCFLGGNMCIIVARMCGFRCAQ